MIAASLKEPDELVDLFLRKDADVNAKSKFLILRRYLCMLTQTPDFAGQVPLSPHFPPTDLANINLDGPPLRSLKEEYRPRSTSPRSQTTSQCSSQR